MKASPGGGAVLSDLVIRLRIPSVEAATGAMTRFQPVAENSFPQPIIPRPSRRSR